MVLLAIYLLTSLLTCYGVCAFDGQEEAVALLCSMAEFPFYRPAIRKADPAGALTSMLQAGCSPVSLLVLVSIVALLIRALINSTLMDVSLSPEVVECRGAAFRLPG